MNKIEQMHLDAIQWEQSSDITQHGSIIEFVSSDNYYDLAVKSAEITQEIAVEFAEWIAYTKKHGGVKPLQEALIQYKVKSTKELFDKYLEMSK